MAETEEVDESPVDSAENEPLSDDAASNEEQILNLRAAMEKNDIAQVKEILNNKPGLVDVGIDDNNRTLLMKAITRNNADLVSFLCGLGANADTRLDVFRCNALMCAIDKFNDNIFKTIMSVMDTYHPYDFDLGGECSHMVKQDPGYCGKPGAELNLNDSTRLAVEVGLTPFGVEDALEYIDNAASRMQSKMGSRQITPRVPATALTPRDDASANGEFGAFQLPEVASSVGAASFSTAQILSQVVDAKKPLIALHAILLDKDGTELDRITAENNNVVKHFAPHLLPKEMAVDLTGADKRQGLQQDKKKMRRSFSSVSGRKAKKMPKRFQAEGIYAVDYEDRIGRKKLHDTWLAKQDGFSPRSSPTEDRKNGGGLDADDSQSVVSRSCASASAASAAPKSVQSAARLERDAFILDPERHKVGLFLDLHKVPKEVASICFKLEAQGIYAEKQANLRFFTEKPEYSTREKEREKSAYESDRGSNARSMRSQMSFAATTAIGSDTQPNPENETLLTVKTPFEVDNLFLVSLCRDYSSNTYVVPHWMAHFDWREAEASFDDNYEIPETRQAPVEEEEIFSEIAKRSNPVVCSKSSNVRRFPVLIKMVFQNNVTMMMQLLESKASCDIADVEFGITPLGWAARRGFDLIVRKLVEQECDINATDFLGKSPLYAAVEQKRLKVARYLLENKADVNHVNPRSGENPLWECQSVEMAKLLMSHKIDLNWRSSSNKASALLQLASRRCRTRKEAEEIFDIIKLLVDGRADVLAQDDRCVSPLFAAVNNDSNANIAQLFLQEGASVEVFSAICGCANLNEERLCEGVEEVEAGLNTGEEEETGSVQDIDAGSRIGRRNPYFDTEPLTLEKFTQLWHTVKLADGMAPTFFGVLQDAFERLGVPLTDVGALDRKVFNALELLLSRDMESAIDILFDSGQLQSMTMEDFVFLFKCTQVFCLAICNAFLLDELAFCDLDPLSDEPQEDLEATKKDLVAETMAGLDTSKMSLQEMLEATAAAGAEAARLANQRKQEEEFKGLDRDGLLTQIVGDPTSISRTKFYWQWLEEQDALRQKERDVLVSSLKPGEKLSDLFKKFGVKEEILEPKMKDILPPLEKKSPGKIVEALTLRVFGKNKLKNLAKNVGVKEFQELCDSCPHLRRHMFPHWTLAPLGLSKAARKTEKLARQQRGRAVECLTEEKMRSDCHVM
ncbi:unnamed protein product [Amoebophrya sp. A120]|nr:unnamed protein product [Amoebophrya sp. A120]|eukprot:GSA120T00017828001.1